MSRLTKEHFERLVHEHHGAVYRAALRVADDAEVAADVTQEVFVRVLEGKEHLTVAHSERATMCWLAARLAANARRSRRRRHDHEENAMRLRTETDHRSDPADLSANADLHRAVHALVQALPHELRLPLLMRCQDELTLAAIGSALRVPVSTVHDRIESALQRVRTGLGTHGRALSAAALPRLVGDFTAPAVPLGLEARLLALGSRVVPVVAETGRRALVAVLALAGVIGLAVGATSLRSGPPSTAVVAAAAETATAPAADTPQGPERTPVPLPAPPPLPARGRVADGVPPPPADPAAARVVATLTGTVHDAEAWPVAGATVQVVAGGGYKPFAVGEPATTDERGAFRVDVKPAFLDPHKVRLVVRENGRELLTSADITVPRAADAGAIALVLPASVGSATARYECTVAVRDETGGALAGVDVKLCGPERTRPGWAEAEASGKSGADGNAVLNGRGLGKKWLFVDGRPLGRTSVYVPLDVKAAGQQLTTATLKAGGELLADVKALGDVPLDWCNAYVEDEVTGMQHDSEAGPGGLLRFRALGDGPFTLHVNGGHKSPARRTGLRANGATGGEPVRIRLKPRTELRDVGDHMAELHGAVFDAATGEQLSFGPFDVDVMPAFAGESTLPSDRVEPPGPGQRAAEGGTFSEFHEVGLAKGRWAIVVNLPGYAKAAVELEVGEHDLKTGVRVELSRPATVRGRVVDAAGQPVAGAIVFAVGVGALADAHLEAWKPYRDKDRDVLARSPSFTQFVARTQQDGAFALGQLPPGIALRIAARDDVRGFGVRSVAVLRAAETVEHQDIRIEPR